MKRRPGKIECVRRRHREVWSPWWLAALLPALLWFAAPARAQDNGVISGRVTNNQGQPQTVLVHLLAEGDIPAGDAYSDSNGSYVFTGLTSGTYAVVVEADGYKAFRGSTRLDDKIEPRGQVMVILEPVTSSVASRAPIITGSKSAQEVSATHPAPAFNPKAVKEFDKGNKAARSGKTSAAIEHYQEALRIDPGFYPALNNLGAVLERQGNHAQAKDAFLKAAKINPADGEAYINIGHVLYEQGQYQAAIDELRQGLTRSPQSAAGNFFLGSAYFKLHDDQQAESLLKTACALDPGHMAPAHLQLANLYLQRRDYPSAKVQLQTFLHLNPSAPQAPAIKRTLVEIEKSSKQ